MENIALQSLLTLCKHRLEDSFQDLKVSYVLKLTEKINYASAW